MFQLNLLLLFSNVCFVLCGLGIQEEGVLKFDEEYDDPIDVDVSKLDFSTIPIESSVIETDPECEDLKYNVTVYRYSTHTRSGEEADLLLESKNLLLQEQSTNVYEGDAEFTVTYTRRPFLNCFHQEDSRLISYIKDSMLEGPDDSGIHLFDPVEDNIYGEVGQPLDVDRIVFGGEMKNGFFIEAGSFNGEFNSDSLYFEINHNWTGLLVEPIPTVYEWMKLRNRNASYIKTCLSVDNKPQDVTFDLVGTIRDGDDKESMGGISTEKRDEDQIQMQCIPLYSILAALDMPTVNYMSLDVEGAELMILKTIPWDKVDIEVMSVESNLLGRVFPGDRNDLIKYLDEVGYNHLPWGHTGTNSVRSSRSVSDDLFVRKDIPLKMTKEDKEELDRQEARVWQEKESEDSLGRGNELLSKKFKQQNPPTPLHDEM